MTIEYGRVNVYNPNQGIMDRAQIGERDEFINPYGEDTTQKYPLRTKLEIGPRTWRYALMGAVAGVAGKMYQSQVIEANGDVTYMAVNTATAGDKSVEVTNGGNTAIAADEYKDGWLNVQDDTGEGYALQIKGNDAMATSAAGTVFLYDPVKVTFGAGATVSLTHPRGYKVVVAPAGITGVAAGVCMGVITAATYCWLQTAGPVSLLQDGTTANWIQGGPVRASEDDIGGAALEDGADNVDMPHYGLAFHPSADGEYGLVELELE